MQIGKGEVILLFKGLQIPNKLNNWIRHFDPPEA